MTLLTKSRYMMGLESMRWLWIAVNDPKRIPEPDETELARMEEGIAVGSIAKQIYPVGIDIPTDDFNGNILRTRRALSKRVPLFEAGIKADGLYSRIDILNPYGKDKWDIIEVKSSTKVKDYHIQDVSFQLYCSRLSGLDIHKCFLMHINNEYVKHGDIDTSELFTIEDITHEVQSEQKGMRERVESMIAVMSMLEPPGFEVDDIKKSEYGNFAIDEFYESLPDGNVFELYGGLKTAIGLYKRGVVRLSDVPLEDRLNEKQLVQVKCAKDGKAYVDKKAIRSFLKELKYPLYYLDFETISPAIPMFDGTRPYQRIPVQFSVHKVDENGHVSHISYLAKGGDDPRPAVLGELKSCLGDSGSIVVYNAAFEKGVLAELSKDMGDDSGWVSRNVSPRIVDLLMPFRGFDYYNPTQHGSASMKKVLPAICGKGYSDLGIADGAAASLAFNRIMSSGFSKREEKKVREELSLYCGRDTEGMIWIVDELNKLSK